MTSRSPAPATRVMLAGASVAATLGMVAAMSAGVRDDPVATGDAQLRVVVTDTRITPDVAVAAALDAARVGRTVARVPVGAPAEPAPAGGPLVAHTRTGSS